MTDKKYVKKYKKLQQHKARTHIKLSQHIKTLLCDIYSISCHFLSLYIHRQEQLH